MSHFQPPFVVFNFSSRRFTQPGRIDNGDLLILNLTNRKQFWMKKSSIQNQINAKIGRFVPGNCQLLKSMPRGIKIGEQKIEMNYRIEFIYFLPWNKVTLGSFKYR